VIEHADAGVVARLRNAQALRKLIGQSPRFANAIATLPLIAQHRGTVLITGETGTGKELVARAVHYLSDRAAHPFVPVNCGTLSESLVEDTLFGHESGAFTDARGRATGLVPAADNGTLLLDEIGTLRCGAQTALLRFLQDGTYRALGSTKEMRADVRIIAATNAPLEQMVQDGTFRSDLYYRLRVFSIDLPPLRDRVEDVLLLATHFLRQYAPPGKALELSPAAAAALTNYSWPGNVRELEHTVLRAAAVCRSDVVAPEDLSIPQDRERDGRLLTAPSRKGPYQALKREAIATFERSYLADLLATYRGNVTHAARAAGKDRRELAKLLKKHTLDARSFRQI
jgi:two-component system, NtrC family, response regulator GlrR